MDRSLAKLGFLIVVCLVLLLLNLCLDGSASDDDNLLERNHNPLDGCLFVYLDMGSNIGVQIRKLFEPEKFPGAKVLTIFDKYFGPHATRNPSQVCAVGFEPNPSHETYLKQLEDKYRMCGWNVMINTRTGVGSKNAVTRFANIDYLDGSFWPMGVAGRLIEGEEEEKMHTEVEEVDSIRIAEFITDVVATRDIPGNVQGAVVMKLDVEGKELEVIADLVMSGALSHLDNIHVDWTNDLLVDGKKVNKLAESIHFIYDLAREKNLSHITEIDDTDDESFAEFTGDFPECKANTF